jgi:hypothetical protein
MTTRKSMHDNGIEFFVRWAYWNDACPADHRKETSTMERIGVGRASIARKGSGLWTK